MKIRKIFGMPPLAAILVAAVSLLIIGCGSAPDSQESGEQNASSASLSTPDEACDAFAGMSGLGGFGGFGGASGGFANLLSKSQGGPSFQAQYSTSAPSDEAGQIAGFFEDALTEALGSGVEAKCYWEVTSSEGSESGRGLWVSLQLPGDVSSDAVQKIQSALSAKGATVGGFFGSSSGGESSAMIMVSDLPLDIDGETGGMLMITEEYAILIAGQDSGGEASQQQSEPTGSSSSGAPIAEPPSPTVSINSYEVSESLRRTLEDALDVSLVEEGLFQSSSGGVNNLLLNYKLKEGESISADVTAVFSEIIEAGGGTIIGTISVAGMAIVNFENLNIEGEKATGSLTYAGDQDSIIVTMEF